MQREGQGDGRWGTGGLLGDIGAVVPPWPRPPPAPSPCPCPGRENTAETRSPYLCRQHGGAGRAASRPRRCPAAAAGRRAGGQPAAACAHREPPSSPSCHHGAAAFSCKGRKLGQCREQPWGGTRELLRTQAHFWKPPRCTQDLTASFGAPLGALEGRVAGLAAARSGQRDISGPSHACPALQQL